MLKGSAEHVEDLMAILGDLSAQPRRGDGRSLERLAEFLCSLLHLTPVRWLVRGSQSGGAEAQVLAQEDHLPPLRWLLQCIDMECVSPDTIATAVGRGLFDSPHYLLAATPGRISSQARKYAATTSGSLHLLDFTIMLFDGEDLRALAKNTTTIDDLIRREIDQ